MSAIRWNRRAVLASMGLLSVGAGIGGRAGVARATAATRYTMTAFTNDTDAELFVYESEDATNFALLRGGAYRPPSGLVRDPSLLRHTDGSYYIAYTTAGDGHTIGFARSTDRLDWTHVCDYPVPVPKAEAAWAPTWFTLTNGFVGVLVSISQGHGFTPYLMIASDPARPVWSPPVPLIGIGPQRPGHLGFIDTTLVAHDGNFYAFTKNESTKFIELAVASTPLGPYRFIATGDWAGWGAPREGQCVIALPKGGHRIYFDAYTDQKYFYSDSFDSFRTWTAPTQLPELSGTVRHVAVLSEPAGTP
ncbi:family 43 glycosylhydrolase [Nocardia niigatensis]|uniref:family 43 glycosylhydrolase n=1 Tax=Nocardia niigatensis TaxID=209249 RepID=UPI00059495E4|nr:family 43 glycosylhydrolase [Nocardia niigatensis]